MSQKNKGIMGLCKIYTVNGVKQQQKLYLF